MPAVVGWCITLSPHRRKLSTSGQLNIVTIGAGEKETGVQSQAAGAIAGNNFKRHKQKNGGIRKYSRPSLALLVDWLPHLFNRKENSTFTDAETIYD